ncbi:WYL domain-containing protein [Vibrio parahaemolyticus]|uniref:helix-turn-helix transcriptional regulator n=1 Tax=Vibrio parahaemolyticus TaxID=670 RepID=UPI001B828CC5|nr:WYL domain-containing protein [Vibrio parahaemolyticus]MCQ9054391.1 WYL domain-containing protein [Vibrio parahaemolyticus]HBC3428115.1 WYL domain-containing protein [Vibrio parahaemolyticus]
MIGGGLSTKEARFRVIELLAYWEGVVNASKLAVLFQVTVNNITKSLAEYRKEYPDSLSYNKSEKRFEPTSEFHLHYIDGSWEEYTAFLRLNNMSYSSTLWGENTIDFGPAISSYVAPQVSRILTQAIAKRLSIQVTYHSLSHPEGRKRTLHPIGLANSGLRWHCRAYDEYRKEFRDFNVSRMKDVVIAGNSPWTAKDDDCWMQTITLRIAPQPALTDEQKRVIMMDKGEGDFYEVSIRAAMAEYYLQFHLIDKHERTDKPTVRPLYLENLNEVSKWLF